MMVPQPALSVADDDEDNDQPNTLTSRDNGSNTSTAQTVQTAQVDTLTLIRHLLRLLCLQQTRRWFVTLLMTTTNTVNPQ